MHLTRIFAHEAFTTLILRLRHLESALQIELHRLMICHFYVFALVLAWSCLFFTLSHSLFARNSGFQIAKLHIFGLV
jgi:hypothetical protein